MRIFSATAFCLLLLFVVGNTVLAAPSGAHQPEALSVGYTTGMANVILSIKTTVVCQLSPLIKHNSLHISC